MVILAVNTLEAKRAQTLNLNLPILDQAPKAGYFLTLSGGEWVVKNQALGKNFVVQLDFAVEMERLRRQHLNPKKDLLSRALGYRGQDAYLVVDGTLGMGQDSLHILSLGCRVVAYEINPFIHFFVQQALDKQPDLAEKWQLQCGDITKNLDQLPANVDCLYLDPMFENAKKKSAPKKKMLLLRELATERDPDELVAKAIQSSVKRVVVKRPMDGDHLVQKPTSILPGSLIRFDVYVK